MSYTKYSLRTGFVIFTVWLIFASVIGKREYDQRLARQISEHLGAELSTTRSNIEDGKIYVDQPVASYLKIASPCDKQAYGEYIEYRHGFTGGLGHGLTVTVKNDRLVKANSWSCVGGDTYFNSMTKSEEAELDQLWQLANRR